jgi:hypothetical protein
MQKINVVAQRIKRSGNSAFLFTLPIDQALDLLEIPDPDFPFPDNRRVSKKHAMDFGQYWETHEIDWIVPPLLLDSPKTFNYKEIIRAYKFKGLVGKSIDSELVELQLIGGDRESLRILDGQHRILGWYLKRLELDERLSDATSSFNKFTLKGDKVNAGLSAIEIELIKKINKRLQVEHVAVNLVDSLNTALHQQFFVDIAKNALGINKTVQSKFDTSSIINRVTQSLIKSHQLLSSRVDLEKTTCSGANPNLLTVVNVADITRHACFGVNGRVNLKKENNYNDEDLLENVRVFIDIITKQVPQLQHVMKGQLSTQTLRENYLLGSGTIWRCLAGAFYETCVVTDDDLGTIGIDHSQLDNFERFLSQLSENMELPISRKWFETNLFPQKSSKAPSSRAQDLSAMVDLMTAWSHSGEMFSPRNSDWL